VKVSETETTKVSEVMDVQNPIVAESCLSEESPPSIEKTQLSETDGCAQSQQPAEKSLTGQNSIPESCPPDELQSSSYNLMPNALVDCPQPPQSLKTMWNLMLEEKTMMDRINKIDDDIAALMTERKILTSQQMIIKQKQLDALHLASNSADGTLRVRSHAIYLLLLFIIIFEILFEKRGY